MSKPFDNDERIADFCAELLRIYQDQHAYTLAEVDRELERERERLERTTARLRPAFYLLQGGHTLDPGDDGRPI
jgi:hypothetical protein